MTDIPERLAEEERCLGWTANGPEGERFEQVEP
jgi:hypothetical protein